MVVASFLDNWNNIVREVVNGFAEVAASNGDGWVKKLLLKKP